MDGTPPIKEEQGVDGEAIFDVDEPDIKEEDDFILPFLDKNASSDEDNEPLSLHKEKKIKEIEEGQIKEDEDIGADIADLADDLDVSLDLI